MENHLQTTIFKCRRNKRISHPSASVFFAASVASTLRQIESLCLHSDCISRRLPRLSPGDSSADRPAGERLRVATYQIHLSNGKKNKSNGRQLRFSIHQQTIKWRLAADECGRPKHEEKCTTPTSHRIQKPASYANRSAFLDLERRGHFASHRRRAKAGLPLFQLLESA